MSEFQVWTCKIIIAADAKKPNGFDAPPRRAAIDAVESVGIEVISCFSGWGGKIDDIERKIIANKI